MPACSLASRLPLFAGLVAVRSALGLGHLHADRPESYPPPSPHWVKDGSISYVVDMSGLRRSPNLTYTAEQVGRIERAIVRAFDTWNGVLAPLNLQFEKLPKWRDGELNVFTFNYERLLPSSWIGDSLAGAHSFTIFGLSYVQFPIIYDNTERFDDLADEPAVIDRPLGHPYMKYTESDAADVYSVALHEIGHVLGLAHPAESFKRDESYNFLALESVRIDARCMAPSEFVCGQHIARRRPLLRTEISSIMAPLEFGAVHMDIPPGDRAFVAFALRYLNPAGADEILAEARRLFLATSPLRFANVFEEYEKDLPGREDNNTIENAQTIEPNSIIVGSLAATESEDGYDLGDVDVYSFEVTEETAEATWHFDVDYGGGLPGPTWVDAKLTLLDETGQTLAENDDTDQLDPGSITTDDPFLTFRFDAPGRYYLEVSSMTPIDEFGSTGDYELRVGVGGVPEPQGLRDVIPALADPSVADCLGTDPIDTSAVCCQEFGILAATMLAFFLILHRCFVGRRAAGPR